MHTGDAASLHDKEQKAFALAEEIAELMTQLDAVEPGSVRAMAGRVTGLGVEIRNVGGRWVALEG